MSALLKDRSKQIPASSSTARGWLLIAAYDVSIGDTSEGYVAFNILKRLAGRHKILLLTRQNNRLRLLADPTFRDACPGVRVLGFDLPRWARWWKRGARFYGLYAYLWQLCWPLAFLRYKQARDSVDLVHILNFHNDSIPTLAWLLKRPLVWGPINHHELAPNWFRSFWPRHKSMRQCATFWIRCIAWRIDPLLYLTKQHATVILSAGAWVDRRLSIQGSNKVMRQSQLGVDEQHFVQSRLQARSVNTREVRTLVFAGRLDWLKGADIAIEALARLPEDFRLLIIGKGPAEYALRMLASRVDVKDRVDFRPPVARAELADIYARADAFLFTSPEVAGLAWIEALCCGLPVVGMDGETEIAQSGREMPGVILAQTGALRSENILYYANSIIEACDRTPDREQIRAAAVRRYGWDRMVSQLEAAYVRCRGRSI